MRRRRSALAWDRRREARFRAARSGFEFGPSVVCSNQAAARKPGYTAAVRSEARSTRTAGDEPGRRKAGSREGSGVAPPDFGPPLKEIDAGIEEDVSSALGFLSSDGVLYCSRACALSLGVSAGDEVDQDEYDSLVEGELLQAGGLCPGCGSEFAVTWPEREPN